MSDVEVRLRDLLAGLTIEVCVHPSLKGVVRSDLVEGVDSEPATAHTAVALQAARIFEDVASVFDLLG